jgi:hypothetical protein
VRDHGREGTYRLERGLVKLALWSHQHPWRQLGFRLTGAKDPATGPDPLLASDVVDLEAAASKNVGVNSSFR